MENIWFVSDLHAWHTRIMEFCKETRRGSDAEEMTWLMVDAWNSLVNPADRVYCTGDFSFGGKTKIETFKKALNGQIHLVLGNHDKIIKKDSNLRSLFASVQDYKTMKVAEHRFIMFHFPIAEWEDAHKGSIHIHGHVHGNKSNLEYQQKYKIFDAGIDARPDNKMIPWHIDEVLYFMKNRDILSHHGEVE